MTVVTETKPEKTEAKGTHEPEAEVLTRFYLRIEPSRGWVSLKLRELWEYRELLYFLVWRDVKVRVKRPGAQVRTRNGYSAR